MGDEEGLVDAVYAVAEEELGGGVEREARAYVLQPERENRQCLRVADSSAKL